MEEATVVDAYFSRFVLPEDLHSALQACRSIAYIETQEELDELVFGPTHSSRYDVVYNIVGKGSVKEAEVIRCKNGASVNFMEDYMRRRDPNSMVISDDLPTDKPRFQECFGYPFADLRKQTMDWFSNQRVILLPFKAGDPLHGYDSLLVCPANAAFFALGMCMALLTEWGMRTQGIVCGVIGMVLGLVTLLVWRKMEDKAPIKVSGKTVGTILLGVFGALLLGVGMSLSMVFDKMLLGIMVGIIGIVVLLMLIPLTKGLK